MSKKDEALKLALEALEEINRLSIGENAICLPAEIDTAMDAIREALAEPMEWLTGCPECGMDGGCGCDSGTWNPPAQQEEKPTTREEILSMAREAGIHVYPEFEGAFELFAALVAAHVRETDAKLKEKNT